MPSLPTLTAPSAVETADVALPARSAESDVQAPTTSPAAASRERRAQRILLGAALAAGLVPLLAVLDDPDLWWHMRVGQWILDHHAIPRTELFSYTAQGNPVTYHEWGSEVLFTVLSGAGGLFLLSLVTCGLAWSGLVALALRARDRGAPLPAIAVAVLLAAKVLQTVAGPRPQMLGFALTCWVLLVAERHLLRGGRLVWLLPALMLVWANLHGGFIYGIAILIALTGIEAVRTRLGLLDSAPAARVRSLGVATMASVAAACVNPFGPGLYVYALTAGQTVSHRPIAEWQSPNFHDSSSWALLVLIVAWMLLAGATRGPGLRDAMLGTAGIVASLFAIRNTELAAALAIPAVAVMMGYGWSRLEAAGRAPRIRLRAPLVLAAAAVAAVAVLVGLGRIAGDAGASAQRAAYPACSAQALAELSGDIRIHAAYFDSGYLILRGWPHVRVYNYGESVSLGDQVLANDLRISSGTDQAPSALSLLDQSGTNAILTDHGGALDSRLAVTLGWRLAATDHGRALWVRGSRGSQPSPITC